MALRSQAKGLSAILNEIARNPTGELAFDLLNQAEETVQQSLGFRFQAAATEQRRDRILTLFLDLYRARHNMVGSDEEVKHRAFQETSEEIINSARLFLVVALQFIRPRSNFDAKPAITTLYNYQKTLLWWILREANNAPTRERFLNSTNETLQFAGRKLGVAKSRKVKAYLGRLELAQLIDFDTMQSPFLPVAEMHHLAWTLGCICGVRPGSLAYSHHRENDFLKWKDVSLTRGQEKGAFSVKVTFWHLKGNQNQLGEARPLEFYINSPTQVDHIAMSPAHRFIVMLLRRKGLADYSSLNELLNGQHKAIRITDSLLEQPVLLAAGPRGLSVTEKPASASSLTEYMGNRAMKAGYQRGITMYAWRRKAATELRRAIGLDGARAFMGHRPGTTTLMDKYEQGNFDLPVFEIAMRLDTRASIATMDEDASPALTRLIDRTRLEGIFLQRTIDRLASESEDLQSAIREKNYAAERNARRRIKKFATQVLHDESKRLAERTLTVEAFNQRKAELQEPMALSSIIDKRVQQLMATSRSEPSTCSTTRESSGVEESENADLRFDDIRDAEDDLDLANQQALVEAEVDPEGSHSDEAKQALDPESNFLEHVRVFMECAGQEKFVMEAEGHLRCSLCLEDDTITLANKNKIWSSRIKLQEHMSSKEHCKRSTWVRRVDNRAAESTEKKRYACPYGNGCKARYTERKKLIEHIKKSTAESTSQAHDDAKRDDGWYDEDWEFDVIKAYPKRIRQERRAFGLNYSNEQESDEPKRVRIEAGYEVTLGAGSYMNEIPEEYKRFVFSGSDPERHPFTPGGPVPDVYRGIVFGGDDHNGPSYTPGGPVPAIYRDTVFMGDDPRSRNFRDA